MIPVGILTAAATSSFSFLLDEYPSAIIGLSLRKLKANYTGFCIDVRRSFDNAVQSIGFVNNYLDTTALLTFCGLSNGFILKWYDQTGNGNDGNQTTNGFQPQIVFNGNLLIKNSKAYIQAQAGKELFLLNPITKFPTDNYSYWFTYEKSNTNNNPVFTAGAGAYLWLDYNVSQYVSNGNTINITGNTYLANTAYLVNNIATTSNVIIYRNSNNIGTTNLTVVSSFQNFPLGALNTCTTTMCELIYYPSSQSANRIAITNNINTYYTIF